ncbi:MAG TPA: A24 family peptidase [Nocardioidaceae bacterium]|nr:A24 family peptidase [Nocardioidaceae bacterium]
MSAQAWFLDTAIATGLYGLVAGMLVPALIGRIPEPEPVQQPPTDETGGIRSSDERPEQAAAEAPRVEAPRVEEPKELYADIARRRGLRTRASVATGVVAALIGGRVGWGPELSFLLFLAPVGVALAVIDWRTRLLPTKLIAPTYMAVVALCLVSAWAEGDWHPLVTAGWGWLVAGGTFFALWFIYPRGMGYGDVRLSGVLGIALGYLGWSELLTGVYAGFLVGGVGGLLLSLLRIVDRKAYPFGPFMLVGALVGVVAGPYVAAWYA